MPDFRQTQNPPSVTGSIPAVPLGGPVSPLAGTPPGPRVSSTGRPVTVEGGVTRPARPTAPAPRHPVKKPVATQVARPGRLPPQG